MYPFQRRCGSQRRVRGEEGQSLLETAVTMPLLLGIAFNLINVSYFWFVLLALSAAPRQGVEYATQGGIASATASAPGTSDVKDLVYENVTNAIKGATTSNVTVRVCTSAKGVNSSTHVALCDQFGPAVTFSGPDADPEAPLFVLAPAGVSSFFPVAAIPAYRTRVGSSTLEPVPEDGSVGWVGDGDIHAGGFGEGPAYDPQRFVLDRVDVVYTVTPIIPGTAFNVVLPANLHFHRQVSMRSLY